MGDEIYFSHDYEGARARFCRAAAKEAFALDRSVHPNERGPTRESLSQDIALFGDPNADCWLVALCGTHGPEGYAGSAIQLDWISRVADRIPPELGVALIHGVNPWGFAHGQRTTENNIDLNRNFVDDETRTASGSEIFSEIAAAMTVDAPTSVAFANFESSREELIRRHGRDAYVNAFAKGQYDHPNGPFYGGASEDWANESLTALLKQYLGGARRMALIDWHTGLGDFGELFYLCFNKDQVAFDRAVRWWGAAVEIGAQGFDNAKRPNYSGTVCQGVMAALPATEIVSVVIEIGTYSFSKMSEALLVENWLRSPAGLQAPDRAHWLNWASEHFNPDNVDWRRRTVARGRDAMDRALDGICGWV